MNIGIIGLGYVGLTLAIAMADKGVRTYGVEINETITNFLKERKAHFFEPNLDDLINKTLDKTFFFLNSFPKDVNFDAFVITVGTPLKDNVTPNFDYIKSALKSIKEVYTGDEVVILRSTVSVGTTRNIVLPFLQELCGDKNKEILVSMCPERTVEGKAIEELSSLPQIVSGNNEKALQAATDLFSKVTPNIIKVDALEEAELIKLYCNVYRDMNFALGNVLCMASQEFNIDGAKIIGLANQDYSRCNIALPGFVAGPCLEKDAYILTNNMNDCKSKDFILNARNFNESLEDEIVNYVEKLTCENKEKIKITLTGLAFKGVPETSDLRGSTSIYIAKKLKAKGYSLNLHDFVTPIYDIAELELGDVYENIEDAIKDSSIVLILNNHSNYKKLSSNIFNENIKILDTWNVCSQLDGDLDVQNLGNMNIRKRY